MLLYLQKKHEGDSCNERDFFKESSPITSRRHACHEGPFSASHGLTSPQAISAAEAGGWGTLLPKAKGDCFGQIMSHKLAQAWWRPKMSRTPPYLFLANMGMNRPNVPKNPIVVGKASLHTVCRLLETTPFLVALKGTLKGPSCSLYMFVSYTRPRSPPYSILRPRSLRWTLRPRPRPHPATREKSLPVPRGTMPQLAMGLTDRRQICRYSARILRSGLLCCPQMPCSKFNF